MTIDRLWRRALDLGAVRPAVPAFRRQSRAFERARLLVAGYYAVLMFQAVLTFEQWDRWLSRSAIEPLWPVAWLGWLGEPRAGIQAILLAFLVTSVAAAIWPEKRWARLLVFVALLEFDAMRNSFGKIGHSYHLFVLTALILVSLPAIPGRLDRASRESRQRYLTVFAACQAMILLTYTMSGLWKILAGLRQMARGEDHAFHPLGLPRLIADRLVETNVDSLLGPFLIEHIYLAWPLFLVAIALEAVSIAILNRPVLHRPWAILMIAVHLGIMLAMTITFERNVLLLGLFFLLSPFAPREASVREIVAAVPGVRLALRTARRLPRLKAGGAYP
jgi:hypothetical protein